MVICGNYGEDLQAIYCAASNIDVLTLDYDENQAVSPAALVATKQPTPYRNAPEGCILTLTPADRKLGSLVICKTCPHATLEGEFSVEI